MPKLKTKTGDEVEIELSDLLEFEVPVKVSGRDGDPVKIKDLQASHQKNILAEQRVQEATELKKAYQEGIEGNKQAVAIVDDLRKAHRDKDMDAMVRALTALGVPREAIEHQIELGGHGGFADYNLEDLEEGDATTGEAQIPPRRTARQTPPALSKEDQEALAEWKRIREGLRRRRITPEQYFELTTNELIEDGQKVIREKLGAALKSVAPFSKLSGKAFDAAVEIADSTLRTSYPNSTLTAEVLRSVVKDTAERMEKLGVTGDSGPGVGPTGHALGADDFNEAEAPSQRPPVTQATDYAAWILKRMRETHREKEELGRAEEAKL